MLPKSPAATTGSIVYNTVTVEYYDNGDPYLHDVLTNNTDKTITEIERCMLAYDKLGNPLKLNWNPFNSDGISAHEYLYNDEVKVLAGKTADIPGGWSLSEAKLTKSGYVQTNKVAYSLYCIKQVTFSDGTVWDNQSFEEWIKTYKGKKLRLQSCRTITHMKWLQWN